MFLLPLHICKDVRSTPILHFNSFFLSWKIMYKFFVTRVKSSFCNCHQATFVTLFNQQRISKDFLNVCLLKVLACASFVEEKDRIIKSKVIREKSRGEGSLIEQDTIENVSESNFFLKLFKKKNIYFLVSFYAKNVFTV